MSLSRIPRLSTLELALMRVLWARGASSVKAIRECLPVHGRPAYTTVQTMVYRLEAKGAVRRVPGEGRTNVFEPAISEASTHHRLIDDFLALFGGNTEPLMTRLVETGRLTLEDVDDVRRSIGRAQERRKERKKR